MLNIPDIMHWLCTTWMCYSMKLQLIQWVGKLHQWFSIENFIGFSTSNLNFPIQTSLSNLHYNQ